MKKLLVLLLLSVWIIPKISFASAQDRVTLDGTVVLRDSGEPVAYAHVLIKELNLWGFSNEKGNFTIKGIIPGSYTLEATSLGYQKFTLPVTLEKNVAGFKIQLLEENLTLKDVVVTAKAGSSMNSSSRVDKRAIEHLQATSLADVMQLMPGTVIKNPDLTSKNVITIRSVNATDAINARGVGLLVNGSKVSGDAQGYMNFGEAVSGYSQDLIDFRSVSTDNIESVEVLKGVLSAEYGDVTSGAIIVTTKAGRTPYEIRVKSDPRTKAVSFGKGFSLGPKNGNLNVDVDYARSFKDWISPVDIFDRTTLGLTYSNVFDLNNKPLRFNARFSGYVTGNSITNDPDVSKEDFIKSRNNNFTLSLYGNWQLNKPWITGINYNISGSYGKSDYNKLIVTNQLPLPTTNTMIEGIALGYFTNTLDRRNQHIEEIPMYLNAKISANLNKNIGGTLLKSLLGIEYNTKGNNGRGEYYTEAAPQYFRERSYKDIPAMTDISLFAEEKVSIPIGNKKSSIDIMVGARLNKMIIQGYDYDPTIDPRTNIKFTAIAPRRDGFIRELAFRGGWGIMQKLPSLGLLYPDPNYDDFALFQYRNSTTGEQLALIQSMITDNKLPYNLKPNKSYNTELGVDLNIAGIEANITYFNEQVRDGFMPNASYEAYTVNYYNTVSDVNAAPKYENGKIWVRNTQGVYEELGFTTVNEFKAYKRPDNRGRIDKWGIEYDFDFGTINPINTSVIVNGAYIRTENTSPGDVYINRNNADPIDPKQRLPYLAIFKDDAAISIGAGRERLSTNINLVTRIPSIRMVITFTTQCIWMENNWNLYDDGKIYSEDADGNPVYGDYNNKNNLFTLYRDPVSYVDKDGVVRPFSDFHTTTDDDLKRRLDFLRESSNNSFYFLTTGYKPYFMANIRLTKELGNVASLSFYANNFTNSRPRMVNKARPNASPATKNTLIYFGAELKITL